MSETGGDAVTPELALVHPERLEAQRQTTEGKAAMSSTEPSNGTFFVDPAQPAPPPTTPEAAPAPTLAPAPDAAPAQPPAPAPAPAAAGAFATPMVDVPLGTLIFRAGLLAEEQLEDALQEGMRTGKRLGEVLLERGWLHERDLGRMLAGQKGLPFVEISAADAEPEALAALPPNKAMLQTTLPLRYEEGQLVVAVADPSNELVLENLRRALGAEPRLVVAAHGDLTRAIEEAYTQTASPTVEVTTPEPQPVESPPVQVLQPEPPQPAPLVTPLPTVLPAAEERSQEPPPQPAPLQPPLVVEPPAQVVVEPAADVVVVEPAAAVVAEPSVVMQEPVVQPFAEHAPAPPPETTYTAQPEHSAPLETTIPTLLRPEPVLEPLAPALPAEPPAHVPEVSAPEAAPMPLAPEPSEPVAALPIQPEPAGAPEPPAAVEPVSVEPELGASLHIVLLRLREGDVLQVGTFHTAAEASAHAQEVVREIAAAEGASTWPFFAERYLRPDTIVSVDLLEEHADKWMGSAARARWAQA